MRFATITAALAAPLLVSAAPTRHKRASANDILVLQFADVLEQLESIFYTQALAKFVAKDFTDAGISIPDIAIQGFQGILSHETAHSQFLEAALDAVGAQPVKGCTFNFDSVLTDVPTMISVARVVEAVGVGAYLGGATIVDDKSILVAAASILTIEARHQSFLNTISGATATPQPFDIALTPPQVLALAGGFITGCDLGIPANDPIAITNKGAVTPGTKLTFDSPALAKAGGKELSCQMLTGGGNATALSFPLDQCIVPSGINGPVAIFLTTDPQPLAANVVTQNASQILAGPTLAFIDTEPDALGSIVRKGSNPVGTSNQVSQDQAQSDLAQASGSVTSPAATGSSSAATGSSSAATGSSSAATGSSSAATGSSSDATGSPSATPSSTPTAAQDNSAPTNAPVPAVKVIGLSTISA